jgi:hypothetical protein
MPERSFSLRKSGMSRRIQRPSRPLLPIHRFLSIGLAFPSLGIVEDGNGTSEGATEFVCIGKTNAGIP